MLVGTISYSYIHRIVQKKELEIRRLHLEEIHNRSVTLYNSSVLKFAGIVSGIKSYVNNSESFPSATQLQFFIREQYEIFSTKDSIVVSYVDTSQIFRYSFTLNQMNPSGLVGKLVSSYRSEKEIVVLDSLMRMDGLTMLDPINLYEGWVGIPFIFGVHRDNKVLGYVSAILKFKSIAEPLYQDKLINQKIIHHFSTEKGIDFDRERVYDNNKVYNNQTDDEYYKNFTTDETGFINSKISRFGLVLNFGSAYKKSPSALSNTTKVLFLWYLTFLTFAILLTWQITRYVKLNSKLKRVNKKLQEREKKISIQNDELNKLNATKDKLFSIVGHDLKSPMVSILNLLYLINSEENVCIEIKDHLSDLEKTTNSTIYLLENLLRWAQINTNGSIYNPSQVNLSKIIQEVAGITSQQASAKNISLKLEMEDGIVTKADPDMISLVVRNLVSNAIKFTNPGGEVKILLKPENEQISIQVKDNGVGMNQEIIQKILDSNNYASSFGTNGEKGTGLGLQLCFEFVKIHGGRIEIESKPNEGSAFSVILPIAAKI